MQKPPADVSRDRVWRAQLSVSRLLATRSPLVHCPEAGRAALDLSSLRQRRCDGTRRSSRDEPGWVSGRLQPLPSSWPLSQPVRAPRPEPAHPAPGPFALPAPSGELGGAQNPGRALSAPHPLPGPILAGSGSAAPYLSSLRNCSALVRPGPAGIRRDRTSCAAPAKERVRSLGAPDVTTAPSAASSESPDHLGNPHGAGQGGGRCHSKSPDPCSWSWKRLLERSRAVDDAEPRGPSLAWLLRPLSWDGYLRLQQAQASSSISAPRLQTLSPRRQCKCLAGRACVPTIPGSVRGTQVRLWAAPLRVFWV